MLTALGRLVAPRSKKRFADWWALPWINLTSMQLARGEVRAAAASAMRRTEILAPLPVRATTGLEFFDSFLMAAECKLAPVI